jgi:hypothetical protein
MRKVGKRFEFEGKLIARGPGGAWTFLPIPFGVEQPFGTKARVPVSGTINKFAFRNSLLPEGDGTHSMTVGEASITLTSRASIEKETTRLPKAVIPI